ncbi:HAD-like domain-containing protein [Dipodascopsis tothii]|uniref:HAD-like domain-containing protein n=1 Tax=Dipodascopsis tothii TaxID=44089 RepID=UPI0034CF27CF
MASIDIQVNGFLFDLDGTLIDSGAAVDAHWERFALKHGFSVEEIQKSSHGVRSVDVIAKYLPELATPEHAAELEAQLPRDFADKTDPIPGAHRLVEAIVAGHQVPDAAAPGQTRTVARPLWGIVTSGTRPLASGWLKVLRLEEPDIFITADVVKQGKPHPEGYMLGRTRMGLAGADDTVVVFEDAPAGVRAGNAAGCVTIALCTTNSREAVAAAGATYIVKDLSSVEVVAVEVDAADRAVFTLRLQTI